MTSKTLQYTTKEFKYTFSTCTNEDVRFKVEVPVEIPYGGSSRELVQRVINMLRIPVYLEDELNVKLAEFITEETKKLNNERDGKSLNQLKNGEINVEGIIKTWERLFKENVMDFAEQKGTPDEEVFAAAYHKLVHSPALETILQVENSYAKTVTNTLKNRDEDIQKLTQRQTEEMEEKVSLLNISSTELEINELATQHFEEQALVAARCGSQLDALWHAQRAELRAWLLHTHDHYQTTHPLHTPTPSNSPLGTFSPPQVIAPPLPSAGQRLEESFTIHLGSQLKQTHNIRIVAMDLLDLCHLDHDNPTESSRRLQSALSLYSSELSCVVLVCEAPPPALPAIPAALLRAASASTEYHFPHVEHQLRDIADKVKEPVERRNAQRHKQQTESSNATRARSKHSLQTGDVFVTKHSNLGDVHVVFHLVVDDSTLKSGDISSRHPAILGLRNILKAACSHDITSVSLPLLLTHDLSEAATAAWCVRRAELVLKCVKGFVLEAAGGGGAELRTLQVAVPPPPLAAPPLFAALAQLPPAIFRLSTPLKFKPRPDCPGT